MADLERLEAELSIALRRYADDADVEIDAAEAARAIARRHPRRRWLDLLPGTLPLQTRTAVRVALAVAALLLLLLAAAFVGQRLLGDTVRESLVRGRLDCVQTAAGTTSPQGGSIVTTGLTLDCRLATGDKRATGALSLVITRALVDGRNGTEGGTAILRVGGDTWTGELAGVVAESGARSARVTLEGQGPFRDRRLSLSLIRSEGLSWAVSGTIGPSRQP